MYIAFEGDDGTFKSTYAKLLYNLMKSRGKKVYLTREIGGTPLGEVLRDIVLNPFYNLDSLTSQMLFFADRREHHEKVVKPLINDGTTVISDRSYYSTYAYGVADGIKWYHIDYMKRMSNLAEPDIIFWMDCDIETSFSRIGKKDTYESKGRSYLERVRGNYESLFYNKDNVIRIDTTNFEREHEPSVTELMYQIVGSKRCLM